MKTIGTVLLTAIMLLVWRPAPVQAQQSAPEGEKKIVITKRTIDADGTETTETIIKKGQAAEAFDVEKYIEENRADNVELDVRVKGDDDERKVVIKHRKKTKATWVQDMEENVQAALDEVRFWDGRDHGFLGVRQQGTDDPKAPGVQVSIVAESAAKAAGLQDGDVLLQLNETPVNGWGDITRFMQETKPDDKIQLTYERNGAKNTAEATLGKSKDTAFKMDFGANDMDFNFDYDIKVREKDACLGVYTTASSDGQAKGTRVTDFTKESAAREAEMATGDVITAVNGVQVQGHDALWDEISKYKVGDKVTVDFLRANQPQQIEATLKACRDNSSRVVVLDKDEAAPKREFFLWNWNEADQNQLRRTQVITIRKGAEGDAVKLEQPNPAAADRTLQLEGFRAYPNPAQGQVTVEFHSAPLPTVVSLLDMSGRQLFREELNAFSGDYYQQFDLSEYARGTVIIHVQQNGKVFTEQIVVN